MKWTLAAAVFLIAFVPYAEAAADVQLWQGRFTNGSLPNYGTYTFAFDVYNASSEGTLCYSNTTSLPTTEDGWWRSYQYGVANNCSNASVDYYISISIDGINQSPRRLLKHLKYADMSINTTFNENVTVMHYIVIGNGSAGTKTLYFNSSVPAWLTWDGVQFSFNGKDTETTGEIRAGNANVSNNLTVGNYTSLNEAEVTGNMTIGNLTINNLTYADRLVADNIIIGYGEAGKDYNLTYDGETSDGVLTWMEDEKALKLGSTGSGLWLDGTTGDTPDSGGGTRFMWIPSKQAFRAGSVLSTRWDDANIGIKSIGLGHETKASALGSVSIGYSSIANNTHSFVIGEDSLSSGFVSGAIGESVWAGNSRSYAFGSAVSATGERSMSLGYIFSNGNTSSIALGVNGIDLLIMGREANFQDNNITTTGSVRAGNYTAGTSVLNETEFSYLDGQDQYLNSSSNPTFNNLTLADTMNVSSITSGTGIILNETEFSYLDGQDQHLNTSSNITFQNINSTGSITTETTFGSNLAPELTTPNWGTLAASPWQYLSSPDRIEKYKDQWPGYILTQSTGTAPTAGVSYKITIVIDSMSGAGAALYCSFGGIGFATITSAGTYIKYMTASSTAKMTIEPSYYTRTVISEITALPLTDDLGDLAVGGDITVHSNEVVWGNLQVGTDADNLNQKFVVHGGNLLFETTADATQGLYWSFPAGGIGSRMVISGGYAGTIIQAMDNDAADGIWFRNTGGSNLMYLGGGSSYNGRLGIGTTTPTDKLNVVGGANITGNMTVEANLSVLGNITAGEFHPPYISQSAQPTLNDGAMAVWHDTDDGKTYIVFDEPTEGARKVEMT